MDEAMRDYLIGFDPADERPVEYAIVRRLTRRNDWETWLVAREEPAGPYRAVRMLADSREGE